MTPREIVREQISHHETDPVPYTLPYDKEVGERLDAYYGGDDWRNEIKKYLAGVGDIGEPDWEKLDETHNRDLFGTVWRTDENIPVVETAPLAEPSFKGYDFPTVDKFVDPARVAEAKKFAAEHQDVFTFANTPCLWSSWYLRGFETTMMDIVAEEDFYIELLDRMTQLTIDAVNALADLPADAIMMGDDWGGQRAVLIGPERWRKLYKPRYKRIFDAVRAQGKFSIMHCCGTVFDIMDDIVDTGLDVLESVQPEAAGMNPYELKKGWGDKITFWGGLGTQQTIPYGTPDEIRGEIRKLYNEMSKGGGYILAPAKELRPEVSTENAVAVVEEFISLGNS
jgi:uroporphyrinogen decarboxylase